MHCSGTLRVPWASYHFEIAKEPISQPFHSQAAAEHIRFDGRKETMLLVRSTPGTWCLCRLIPWSLDFMISWLYTSLCSLLGLFSVQCVWAGKSPNFGLLKCSSFLKRFTWNLFFWKRGLCFQVHQRTYTSFSVEQPEKWCSPSLKLRAVLNLKPWVKIYVNILFNLFREIFIGPIDVL